MNWDRLDQEDSLDKNEQYYSFFAKETVSRALDERCVGCDHPRDGECPYVVTPRTRRSWPCFFMVYVEKSDKLEIFQGVIGKRDKIY